MCAGRDNLGDFHEMQIHRLGVAGRQDQGRTLALLWADGAEDVGGGGALLAGRAWTGAAFGPPAGDLVLLGTRFLSCRYRLPSRARLRPGAWGSFFKILDRTFGLCMMARTGRQFAIAHGTQLPAERLLRDGDAELLEDPLRQIDQPPAHHAVNRRDRTAFDHSGDRLALAIIELGGLTWRLGVQQSVRAPRIKPQYPVPDDLETNATDLRRLGAGRTVVNRRQGQ